MAISLLDAFNNVKLVCDGVTSPGLNNTERLALNESINTIASALNEYVTLKEEKKKALDTKKQAESVKQDIPKVETLEETQLPDEKTGETNDEQVL
jgi:hypothetical protein